MVWTTDPVVAHQLGHRVVGVVRHPDVGAVGRDTDGLVAHPDGLDDRPGRGLQLADRVVDAVRYPDVGAVRGDTLGSVAHADGLDDRGRRCHRCTADYHGGERTTQQK